MNGIDDMDETVRALIGAWVCCSTCAGGVLGERDREIKAQAWDEGHRDVCIDCNCPPRHNPYRVGSDR